MTEIDSRFYLTVLFNCTSYAGLHGKTILNYEPETIIEAITYGMC